MLQRRLVHLRIRFDIFRHKRKISAKSVNEDSKLVVIYRISDAGYIRVKPAYINNENCLKNAVRQFPLDKCDWLVIADNVSEPTFEMILKYVPEQYIRRVSVGHGAGTFRLAYEHALTYKSDDYIYFLENDYLHTDNSREALLEGFRLGEADYITLYDHPDKYGYNTENPFVHGGEKSKVFLTETTHWKITGSTTMTFAAKVKTLQQDKAVFWRWTPTSHPYDFKIFHELKTFRKRLLISPIPSYSTHGDTKSLAPHIDWSIIGNM